MSRVNSATYEVRKAIHINLPVKGKTEGLRKATNSDPLYEICLNRHTEVHRVRSLKMDKPANITKANDGANSRY
jgi:hypothetical protein